MTPRGDSDASSTSTRSSLLASSSSSSSSSTVAVTTDDDDDFSLPGSSNSGHNSEAAGNPGPLSTGNHHQHHSHHQTNCLLSRYLCLVMHYYPNGTLQHGLQQYPTYFGQPYVILSVMRQVLSAIAYSHSKNIIHRDLKPGNVLLEYPHHPHQASGGGCGASNDNSTATNDDLQQRKKFLAKLLEAGESGVPTAILTDFGMARDLEATNNEVGGQGTIFYLAPEQLDRRVSKKSDIWAVACLVVAMIDCTTTKKRSCGGGGGASIEEPDEVTPSSLCSSSTSSESLCSTAMFMHRMQPDFEFCMREALFERLNTTTTVRIRTKGVPEEEDDAEMKKKKLTQTLISLLLRMLSVLPLDRPSAQECLDELYATTTTASSPSSTTAAAAAPV